MTVEYLSAYFSHFCIPVEIHFAPTLSSILLHYFSKDTIEFRFLNSTLHAGKIKAYIQFYLAVSAWSITSQENIIFRSMVGYTPSPPPRKKNYDYKEYPYSSFRYLWR